MYSLDRRAEIRNPRRGTNISYFEVHGARRRGVLPAVTTKAAVSMIVAAAIFAGGIGYEADRFGLVDRTLQITEQLAVGVLDYYNRGVRRVIDAVLYDDDIRKQTSQKPSEAYVSPVQGIPFDNPVMQKTQRDIDQKLGLPVGNNVQTEVNSQKLSSKP